MAADSKEEKRDRRKRLENHRIFGWPKSDGRPDNNMKTATETGVTGVGALVAGSAGNLAGRGRQGVAANQLCARQQQN